jgi:hypothetical protein
METGCTLISDLSLSTETALVITRRAWPVTSNFARLSSARRSLIAGSSRSRACAIWRTSTAP